ncbi:hypothetical protein AB1Y20_003251 [Prymnesium parvum]|uniref:Inositol polyphosphate-related phosphatase domain-containing protein n=1 Tax=Prymnesium parvum TaxID=97485 RepID=A0AB34JCW7_PRYPA
MSVGGGLLAPPEAALASHELSQERPIVLGDSLTPSAALPPLRAPHNPSLAPCAPRPNQLPPLAPQWAVDAARLVAAGRHSPLTPVRAPAAPADTPPAPLRQRSGVGQAAQLMAARAANSLVAPRASVAVAPEDPAAWRPAADQTGRIRVYVGTWNMHGKEPPESLAPWVPATAEAAEGAAEGEGFDLYVIGTQEAERSIEMSILNPWKSKWILRLNSALGEGYVCLASHSLMAIHLAVYARRELLPQVSHVHSAHVACGIGDVLGNKGGVGISLCVGRTSILFINSHLAAHQHKVNERNTDYHRINATLGLHPPIPPDDTARGAGCVAEFDRVIWCGDMNYRIQGCRAAIDALLEPPNERARAAPEWEGEEAHWDAMRAVLLGNDQLRQQMRLGRVFDGFQEAEIKFRPTYKFDSKQKDLYDQSEKQRVPAYTDRVLYRVASWEPPDAIKVLRYSSVDELKVSDHRPVFADISLQYTLHHEDTVGAELSTVSRAARMSGVASSESSVCAIM